MTGVFCVIPARSGSTRIQHKNLAELGGTTLLERAIRTALAAFGEVFVSTDDERYAELARQAGASVPSLRPADLASEHAAVEPALRHAVQVSGTNADVLVLLQPTTPFTTVEDCHQAVAALRTAPGAGCAVTAVRAPVATAFALVGREDGTAGFLAPCLADTRTQDLPAMWLITGGVYATWTTSLMKGGAVVAEPIVPVEVPAERAVDIDEPADLEWARALLLR